jgi:DNA-binding MarR family transcriptional regulator
MRVLCANGLELTTLDFEMRATDDDLAAATEALLLASRALMGVAARSIADLNDITLPQYRALIVLNRPRSVTVGDLAEALDIHPSTATRLCDRLERKSLVRRRPGVSPDRRLTPVVLTAKGRRLVDKVTDHRRKDLAAIASSMPQKDLDHVIRALTSFAVVAGELPALDTFGWADSAAG